MKKNIKKEITFICTDKVEKQCCDPIAAEAKKRGYTVKFTENQFEKCEIGFYLSHVNYPKYSKFSAITLHDLGQQHGQWPNIWRNEFWSQFDVGFLPSKEWANMWHDSSRYSFARPKFGCYLSGWIKADTTLSTDFTEENARIVTEYGIDTSKKTILYAPAWEWDEHQIEIVEAVRDLNVNLIIKQFPVVPEVFPWEVELIEETHKKTRTLDLPNVFILDPKINIFNVIQLCDVLVSEESSTLSEAMLLEKPVIAVTDWLVPDAYPNPARLPECYYDFAIKIGKKDLRETIKTVVSDDSYTKKISQYRKDNFPNIGNAARTVMDVIDNILFDGNNVVNQIDELSLTETPFEFRKTVNKRKAAMRHIFIKKRFVDKNKILLSIWNMLRTVKNKLRNTVGGGATV